MRRFLFNLLLFCLMIFPLNVFAEGYVAVAPASLTIEQGESKTFNISVYNAIGDVYISSNDSNVAKVSINEWGTGMVEEKQTKSTSITVTGMNIGTTTITLNVDAATFDLEDLSGQTKTVTINVIEKTTTTTIKATTKNENNITSQNKLYLKSLKVENYELDFKKDHFEYELSIENDIDKLNIDYELEDKNSKVDIIGAENLVEGKNKIEINLTNNNIKTTYIIIVNRKTAINDIENNEEIILNALNQDINELKVKVDISDNNKVITSKILETLKNSKKNIIYDIYDNDKKIYSYKIIGNNINKTDSINFNIKLHSDYSDNINKLIKNKENLVINFEYTGILPKDTEVTVYDIKNINDHSYLYYYNSNKNELEYINEVNIENNTLSLKIDQSDSEYVLLNNKITNTTLILFIIGTVIYGLVIIVVIIYFIIFIKNKKENVK